MHGLQIKMSDRNSREVRFETMLAPPFGMLNEMWKTNVILVASDSALNMMGKCQGVFAHFEVLLNSRFSRIWRTEHRHDPVR